MSFPQTLFYLLETTNYHYVWCNVTLALCIMLSLRYNREWGHKDNTTVSSFGGGGGRGGRDVIANSI